MSEHEKRGTGRRVGRERVLTAAVELLEHAELADFLAFLGTRAVADAADVQPATVHHHFGNANSAGRSNARLAESLLGTCLDPDVSRHTMRELAGVADAGLADAGDVRRLRAVVVEHLEALIADRDSAVMAFLAAASAQRDPLARAAMCERYDLLTAGYSELLERFAEAFGRRFDTAEGFDAEAVAVVGRALADGLVTRHQFDPERVDPPLYGEVALRIFEALTLPADDHPSAATVTERLMERSGPLELPADSGLDQGKRARIVDAVRSLYDAGGAPAITVTAVAREAGVSRGTVLANFGDRSGLAAAVWAQFLPDLERRLEADRENGLPLARVIERHLHRLIDRTKATQDLSALLLDGVIGRTIREGPPTYADPTDPRSAVPLAAMLVPSLADASPQLRPGLADTPEEAKDLAATITNLAMVRAMSRRQETASETVHHVMDLVLDGILRSQ